MGVIRPVISVSWGFRHKDTMKGGLLFITVVSFLFFVGLSEGFRDSNPDEAGQAFSGPPLPEHNIGRVVAGPDCWFKNYYCSFTPENVIAASPDWDVAEKDKTAEDCYDLCAGKKGQCKFFTWFLFRGYAKCYLLTQCTMKYRNHEDHCLTHDPPTCISGDNNCKPNDPTFVAECNLLPKVSTIEPWQCEDGGMGILMNGYETEVNSNGFCYQMCHNWDSKRFTGEKKGFLRSQCQQNDQWTDPIPNDNEDIGTSALIYPPVPSKGTYYKPSESSGFDCQCDEMTLQWPPAKSTESGTPFKYNPRFEPAADFSCEDEVLQATIDKDGAFSITPSNTCRFFCDNHLVDVILCKNGKWQGEVETLGLWCYDKPVIANQLNPIP